MKKRLLAAICVIAILAVALLAGCAGSKRAAERHTIGIIGAMDEEVASLKAAIKDPIITTVAGMEFCEGSWTAWTWSLCSAGSARSTPGPAPSS